MAVGDDVDDAATVGWTVIVRISVIDWPHTDQFHPQPPEIHIQFK